MRIELVVASITVLLTACGGGGGGGDGGGGPEVFDAVPTEAFVDASGNQAYWIVSDNTDQWIALEENQVAGTVVVAVQGFQRRGGATGTSHSVSGTIDANNRFVLTVATPVGAELHSGGFRSGSLYLTHNGITDRYRIARIGDIRQDWEQEDNPDHSFFIQDVAEPDWPTSLISGEERDGFDVHPFDGFRVEDTIDVIVERPGGSVRFVGTIGATAEGVLVLTSVGTSPIESYTLLRPTP